MYEHTKYIHYIQLGAPSYMLHSIPIQKQVLAMVEIKVIM